MRPKELHFSKVVGTSAKHGYGGESWRGGKHEGLLSMGMDIDACGG